MRLKGIAPYRASGEIKLLTQITHLIASSPLSNQTTGSFDLTLTSSRPSRVIYVVVKRVWTDGVGDLNCRIEM